MPSQWKKIMSLRHTQRFGNKITKQKKTGRYPWEISTAFSLLVLSWQFYSSALTFDMFSIFEEVCSSIRLLFYRLYCFNCLFDSFLYGIKQSVSQLLWGFVFKLNRITGCFFTSINFLKLVPVKTMCCLRIHCHR